MHNYYLGYVERIHTKGYGSIRPLALLQRCAQRDAWVVDRACIPNEFGPTNLIFWQKAPNDQAHLTGYYVRLKIKPNPQTPEPERNHDEFVVEREWMHGNVDRVSRIGFQVLAESRVFGPDRLLDYSPGTGLADFVNRGQASDLPKVGDTVYRRRKNDVMIDGPWLVVKHGSQEARCLQPSEGDLVAEFDIDTMDEDVFHVWEDERKRTQFVLLVKPPISKGRVVDLLPDLGLAEWLVRKLKSEKDLWGRLESAVPGWRGKARELLKAADDQTYRTLELDRFARLEVALDALADDEARLADLIELPRFKDLLVVAIDRERASRRDEIQAAAVEETRNFVAQQRQEREQEKKQAEREKLALRREVEKVNAEVAEIERHREEATAKVAADESSIRATADYLVESRERIVRDFSAFYGLVEHTRESGNGTANGSANGRHSSATKPLASSPPVRDEVSPDGPAIDSPADFLAKRLVPALASWGADVTPRQARWLHAALLACRWVAAPCPSWGVAYAEAIGAHARHRVVTVEPTWLALSDCWSGELGHFWREAKDHPDVLHLLIFADADRALVQCWARPLLDVISGLRSTLPSGDVWRDNLRVIACPSADTAALPVPEWVLAHWAGIKAASGASRRDGVMSPGHVPFATWKNWIAKPELTAGLSDGLGVAARAAARERSVLAEILRRMEPDNEEQAGEDACEIRETAARSVFARGSQG